MQITHTIPETRRLTQSLRQGSKTLALVPTMGALHAGHLSLVRAARAACDLVAVSIFLNPLQFGPNEDLARYPRTFAADCALLEAEGVDLLFAPSPEIMYPPGAHTLIDLPDLGRRLDGASRPGHFRGVATIVAKLFNILAPDRAFFGQKDAAQVAVLRALVRDLNFDLELVVCPTVREPDGLALSSRNRFLNPAERRQALALSRALSLVAEAIAAGEQAVPTLERTLRNALEASPGLRLDYATLVDPDTLLPAPNLSAPVLVAVAAWLGDTRLIDNLLLEPQPEAKAAQ